MKAVDAKLDGLEVRLAELEKIEDYAEGLSMAIARKSRVLETILENTGCGVIVVDEMGRFVHFNPSTRRMLGALPESVSSSDWPPIYCMSYHEGEDPFPPEEHPWSRALVGEAFDDLELFVRHARALDNVWIKVTARPLIDENGALCGSVSLFRDITEQKNAQQFRDRFVEQTISVDAERRRIARELHDETGQALTSLVVGLQALRNMTSASELCEQAERLQQIAESTVREVGRLARGLHPSALDELGLQVAIERHVAEYSALHGIPVSLSQHVAKLLSPRPARCLGGVSYLQRRVKETWC